MAVTPLPWLTLPWVSFFEPKRSSQEWGGKITQRWAETKSLCLLPLLGTQGDVLEDGAYPWWRTQALPFGSVGVIPHCIWGAGTWCCCARKALARCGGKVLLGQHAASPFWTTMNSHMAAALPSNKGMKRLALCEEALAPQVAHPRLGDSHHCLEIPRPWLEKKRRRWHC